METIYNRLVAQVVDNKINNTQKETFVKPIIIGLCMIAAISVSLYILLESITAFLIVGSMLVVVTAVIIAHNKLSNLAMGFDLEDVIIEIEQDWR